MPRPSLADASVSQPKLPGTERSPATNTPFVVRCRDVRIGSPGAKHVYLTLATWCESYVGDADHGTCWPSLRTVQTATEYGRTAFKEHYQFLLNQRFVTSQKGAPGKSSKKTIWTPDAAMRRRSEGSESDPSRGVGFRPPKDQRRSEVRTPSKAAASTSRRTEQQQQRDRDQNRDRIDGLLAACAIRSRKLGRLGQHRAVWFDEASWRRSLADGSVTVPELQQFADALDDELAVQLDSGDGDDGRGRADGEPCEDNHTMTDNDINEKLRDFAERNLEGAERDAVLRATAVYVTEAEDFPRPIAELPNTPGVQLGLNGDGRIAWLSWPAEAAA